MAVKGKNLYHLSTLAIPEIVERIKEIIKMTNNKNGFFIILLDLLFVAIGVGLLILGLSQNQNILASLIDVIKK